MAITNPSEQTPRQPSAGGAGSTDTTGGRAQLAARLGVGEAALTAQVGTDPSGVDLDALVAAAPLWLLEARAEEALRQAAIAVLRDSTDTGHEEAAGPAPARRGERRRGTDPRTGRAPNPRTVRSSRPARTGSSR